MTTEVTMRTFILASLTTLVLTILPFQQLRAQDPITEYDGIPLVIYPGINVEEMSYPLNFQQMDGMGVFGCVGGNVLNDQDYLGYFSEHNLKVIPQYLWGNENFSHILRYTDSHYSIWEAEGTDPENGNAALFYDTTYTNYFNEGGTEGRWAGGYDVPDNDTLIYGPGYSQNANYAEDLEDTVFYTAEFRMKIEQRIIDPPQDYLNDIVCKIMVTETNLEGVLETVEEREIKVSDFNGWDNWDTLNITRYNMWDNSYDLPEEHRESIYWRQRQSYYTEFMVVWAGLDYVNLYIDKIRVYDDKGLNLLERPEPTDQVAGLVEDYINHQYGETIIGWYAVDEPSSIDNYEPFRIVDHIINSVSLANDYPLRLHTGIASGWNGKFAFLIFEIASYLNKN